MTPTEKAIREIINRRVKEWLCLDGTSLVDGHDGTIVVNLDHPLSSSPAAMIFKDLEQVCTDLTLQSEYKNACAYCGRPAHTEYCG